MEPPRPIIGTTHEPRGTPQGRILIAHGFKGYKDYGFLPWLAAHCAQAGFVAHRFNFSHGGMDHGHGPFDEDAFKTDTWNRQVEDVLCLMKAIREGHLPGGAGPVLLAGHSRGGQTCLLTGGRYVGTEELSSVQGIVVLASPSRCLQMDAPTQAELLASGSIPSPSNRTSQILRVGTGFLKEQLDDPEGHNQPLLVGRIDLPVCIVHGTADDAVPVEAARENASSLTSEHEVHVLEGANHVFNVPNPFPPDGQPPPVLSQVGELVVDFARRVLSR